MEPDAQNAIALLQKVKGECGPSALAYWVTSNTILTLSGARAFCDGVYWSDNTAELNKWLGEISASLDVIKSHIDIALSLAEVQTVRDNEKYAGYELIHAAGLQNVIKQTNLLKKTNEDISAKNIQELYAKLIELFDGVPYKDKDNKFHVAHGILLGYPDKAIIGYLDTLATEDDPFAERSIPADIRGASYYICPQPIYDYPRSLVNDPVIQAHEKLWSKILEDYYHSDFHKALEKDEAFNRKIKELDRM